MNNLPRGTFDSERLYKDAGLVDATAVATVGGVNQIIDLGLAKTAQQLIINASAVEVDTGDERYVIQVQLSNSATFAVAADIYVAASLELGDDAVTAHGSDLVEGVYKIYFDNEINGTTFRYARLNTVVAGTIATGINYVAYGTAIL